VGGAITGAISPLLSPLAAPKKTVFENEKIKH
jgi:hypothetical protein